MKDLSLFINLRNLMLQFPESKLFSIRELGRLLGLGRKATTSLLTKWEIPFLYHSSYQRNGKPTPSKRYIALLDLKERFPSDWELLSKKAS